MPLRIVGIDCATQPKNTGLALATLDGDRLTVRHARVATHATDVAESLLGGGGELALRRRPAPPVSAVTTESP